MTDEQLRLIRLLNGMTQRAFADRLNLSHPLISFMERGERTITAATRRRIMNEFELNEESLAELKRMKESIENGSKQN